MKSNYRGYPHHDLEEARMIRIDIVDVNFDHFILRADKPVRVEVSLVETQAHEWNIVAHAYSGTEDDIDQEPDAVFDGAMLRGGEDVYVRATP